MYLYLNVNSKPTVYVSEIDLQIYIKTVYIALMRIYANRKPNFLCPQDVPHDLRQETFITVFL